MPHGCVCSHAVYSGTTERCFDIVAHEGEREKLWLCVLRELRALVLASNQRNGGDPSATHSCAVVRIPVLSPHQGTVTTASRDCFVGPSGSTADPKTA